MDGSCHDQKKRDGRADVSRQHIQGPNEKRNRDNLRLSTVLAQRPEIYCRGRRRRIPGSTGGEEPKLPKRQQEGLPSARETTLAADMPNDEDEFYKDAGDGAERCDPKDGLQPVQTDGKPEPSPPSSGPGIPSDAVRTDAESRPPSPLLKPTRVNCHPVESPPPYIPISDSSAVSDNDCPTPDATKNLRNFYRIPSPENSEDEVQVQRRKRLRRMMQRTRERRRMIQRGKEQRRHKLSRDGAVLTSHLDPDKPDIAREVGQTALISASQSEADYYDEDEERYKDLQMTLMTEQYDAIVSEADLATALSAALENVSEETGDDAMADAQCGEADDADL